MTCIEETELCNLSAPPLSHTTWPARISADDWLVASFCMLVDAAAKFEDAMLVGRPCTCVPAGSASAICAATGLILMPVHQMVVPASSFSGSFTPVCRMITPSLSTSCTCAVPPAQLSTAERCWPTDADHCLMLSITMTRALLSQHGLHIVQHLFLYPVSVNKSLCFCSACEHVPGPHPGLVDDIDALPRELLVRVHGQCAVEGAQDVVARVDHDHPRIVLRSRLQVFQNCTCAPACKQMLLCIHASLTLSVNEHAAVP